MKHIDHACLLGSAMAADDDLSASAIKSLCASMSISKGELAQCIANIGHVAVAGDISQSGAEVCG